jgi:O-antigen ligase
MSKVPLLSLIFLCSLFTLTFVLVKNPFPQFSSIWHRWQLHEASLRIVFQTNGLGAGIGGFPGYVKSLPMLPDHSMAPHGWFPAILGEFGLFGLSLFLAAYGFTLKKLLVKFTNEEDPISLTLFVSLCCFFISGVGPSTPLVLETHWVVWGISIAHSFTK